MMMKATVVRYQAKADRADENQRLIEAVFAQLDEQEPQGFTYKVFRLEDGVSFVAARDDGTFYFNDFYNTVRIRKVTPDGTISSLRDWPLSMKLIVGPGQSIFGHGLTRIYRADHDRVRTLAGGSLQGFTGDGGPATAATMDQGDTALSAGLAIDVVFKEAD